MKPYSMADKIDDAIVAASESQPVSPSPSHWYYASQGNRIGPISREEIEALIQAGTISADTQVWNGQGEWRSARASEQLAHLFQLPSLEPPPLAAQHVDNRFAWLIVLVPIIGSIMGLLVGKTSFWIFFGLNTLACIFDEKRLKAAGHTAPGLGWALFVPAYLWKRSSLIDQRQIHSVLWVIAFVVSLAIGSASGGQFLSSLSKSPEDRHLDEIQGVLSEQYLTSPASAKWHTRRILKHEGQWWHAFFTLDAQNQFGAVIRANLCVVVRFADDGYIRWNKISFVESNCNPENEQLLEFQRTLNGWKEPTKEEAPKPDIPDWLKNAKPATKQDSP